ncbi:peptidylprolyl isomerase [Acidobacteria bacterium AH-259-D05]|nr:peptidylprolyl isomerase [Acidobacteria bacterium AH-259-D05]
MPTSNKHSGICLVGIVMLVVQLALSLWAQEVVLLNEIVARVNEEIITLTDLKNELRMLRASLQQENPDPEDLEREFQKQKRGVLKTMLQNKMLVQRAEEFGMASQIDVQVASTLEEMRKASGIPDMEVLDQYLRRQGSSLEEYRKSLKQRMIIDSLLQQFVYSKLTLLTPEIEAYYNEHIDRFTEKAEVELKEILFLKEGREISQVRKKAEEVLEKLHSSASFEDLAGEYSEGPNASIGGQIGSFKQGSMAAPIEEVVFQLEEGQVSGIIETEYGLQIIKVVSKKAPHKLPMEEVRPEIVRELYQLKAQPGLREFMDEVREQSYIYVAPKYREEYEVGGL